MTSINEFKHERKECPRCRAYFECKVGDVRNCQCNPVQLNEDVQEYIQEKYADCLCCTCLREIRTECNTERFYSKLGRLLRSKGN
ncbi:MAG: hypothetical protein C0490_23170 [Marivirga sp.]|nr:hypothetical protein [Marivirga sp.]